MRPLRVGLTGGIASGKTAVAKLFAAHGVPVIDSDEIARDVVRPGSPALAKLVAIFGPDILDDAGALNRKLLRDLVFADPQRRRQLEGVLHPAIREESERRAAASGGPYQLFVIPLLIETNARHIDRVLVVDCSEHTQLQRLLARDGGSETQARAMLAAQASRAQRLARADDIIANDGDFSAVPPQVDALHAKYLILASSA